jgi:hypothetical protein
MLICSYGTATKIGSTRQECHHFSSACVRNEAYEASSKHLRIFTPFHWSDSESMGYMKAWVQSKFWGKISSTHSTSQLWKSPLPYGMSRSVEPKKIAHCINLGTARISDHRKKVMKCKEEGTTTHCHTQHVRDENILRTQQTRTVSAYKTVQGPKAIALITPGTAALTVSVPLFHLLSQPILTWDPADGMSRRGHDIWIPCAVEAAPSDPTSTNRVLNGVDYEGSLIRGCRDRQYN